VPIYTPHAIEYKQQPLCIPHDITDDSSQSSVNLRQHNQTTMNNSCMQQKLSTSIEMYYMYM